MFNSMSTAQKWGGLAFFLLAATLVASSLIYLMGNLRDALGPFTYSLADFLSGPVWAVSLITAVYALRERLEDRAPRRMNLALAAAFAAACAFVAVACIRSANRSYHLSHPDLNLESSVMVLTVWTTLVAGVSGAAWHFLGWALAMIASAGWTSRRLPRILCGLYLLAAVSGLFAYVRPELEPNAAALLVIASIWQGILFLTARPDAVQAANPA